MIHDRRHLIILLILIIESIAASSANAQQLHFSQQSLTEPSRQLDQEWRQFMWHHAKVYSGWLEEYYRRMVWESNHRLVLHHNQLAASGRSSFTLGMNQFADMTSAEFASVALSRWRPWLPKGVQQLPRSSYQDDSLDKLTPPQVDWRLKGCVAPVRDQGPVDSSTVFGVVGSAEGLLCAKHGPQPSWLSSQQVFDCAKSTHTVGSVYDYLASNLGRLDAESCYPMRGQCSFEPNCTAALVHGAIDIAAGSEAALQSAVAAVGPVTVTVDASRPSFQLYRSGVYNEPNCSTTVLDHVMLLVGYGDAGDSYWLARNSWGISWGERGYIRMSRNRGNQCGIATDASYPAVELPPPPR